MKDNSNWVILFGVIALGAIMMTAVTHQAYSVWVWPFALLFTTMFGAIGALSLLNIREDRFRDDSRQKHPNEPWLWDTRWQTNIVPSRSQADFLGHLAITIILGVFALIGFVTLFKGLPEGNLWVLLNVIPIIGAAYFLRGTFSAFRSWRVSRLVSLKVEHRPAWLGATFAATLINNSDQTLDIAAARFEHFKIIRRKEHDGDSFEKKLGQTLMAQTTVADNGAIRISVDFPETAPTTSWSDSDPSSWWDLVIAGTVSGRKVSLRYEIPVTDPAADHGRDH